MGIDFATKLKPCVTETMDNCPHIDGVNKKLFKIYMRQKTRTCFFCDADAQFICMEDKCLVNNTDKYLCTKKEHFRKHANKYNHAIYLHLKTRSVFCNLCNRYQSMSEIWRDSVEIGIAGLQNLGNTCYFNAAVQLLANCPPVFHFYSNSTQRSVYVKNCPVSYYVSIIFDEITGKRNSGAYSPTDLFTVLTTHLPMIAPNQQHDAQEFLRAFLDVLHRESMYSVYESLTPCGNYKQSDALKRLKIKPSAKNNKKKDSPIILRSSIHDIFSGQLINSITCSVCKKVSKTNETFLDLSLAIDIGDNNIEEIIETNESTPESSADELDSSLIQKTSTITLKNCLDDFFKNTSLCEENQYYCDKCEKHVDAVKTVRIEKLPEVLCIHLKKFRHENMQSSKIDTFIEYPLINLNVEDYLSTPIKSEYNLSGFISHEGRSAESGHYKAYCRNVYNTDWYEFDDAMVKRLDEDHVKRQQPYILFYVKKKDGDFHEGLSKLLEKRGQHVLKEAQCFLSFRWNQRFSSFTHPGPITNYDFLCPHGGIHPLYQKNDTSVTIRIPRSIWCEMQKNFGGGPFVDTLKNCTKCDTEHENRVKIAAESAQLVNNARIMVRLANEHFPKAAARAHMPLNVISREWVARWRVFVNDIFAEPPGPIDNTVLMTSEGQVNYELDDVLKIDREEYLAYKKHFGGGPELFWLKNSGFSVVTPERIEFVERIVNDQYEKLKEILKKRIPDQPEYWELF